LYEITKYKLPITGKLLIVLPVWYDVPNTMTYQEMLYSCQ